jgi:hypothetical protein
MNLSDDIRGNFAFIFAFCRFDESLPVPSDNRPQSPIAWVAHDGGTAAE